MMRWIEKYRPHSLLDLAGNQKEMLQLEGLIQGEGFPHLLFYGSPGTGKTTTSLIVADRVCGLENLIEINASDDRGIESIRRAVVGAVKHMPLFGSKKIILLDEADGLTADAQQLLRRPMESTGSTTFILTCNNLNKISTAIQSRCVVMEFIINQDDILQRLQYILDQEKSDIPTIELENIVENCKLSSGGLIEEYDLRLAINNLQRCVAGNTLSGNIDGIVNKLLSTQG